MTEFVGMGRALAAEGLAERARFTPHLVQAITNVVTHLRRGHVAVGTVQREAGQNVITATSHDRTTSRGVRLLDATAHMQE